MNARSIWACSNRPGGRTFLIDPRARVLLLMSVVLGCGHEAAAPNPPTSNPVASISITPGNDTLILPLSVQLSAVVRDSSDMLLNGYEVVWTSSNPIVATVSENGLVVAVGLGVDTITATTAGKTGLAVLTVAPIITVTPRRPSMFADDTVQLVAHASDANGATLDVGPLSWSSAAPELVTVSPAGIAHGMSSGLATISASAKAGRGEVVIAVLNPAARPNREIAFLTEGTDFRSELHTIQPDGSGERLVSIPGEYAGQFAWSPDGNRLLVTYLQYNGAGITGLYLSNADGSNPVRIFEDVYAPRWSPDGSRIAFSRCVSSLYDCHVYTAEAYGYRARRLTWQLGSAQSPQWSPDGRRIAYIMVDSADASSLWTMDDDGSHQEQLPLPVNAFNPSWSPDGKTIAVDNGAGVWLVSAYGSHLRPLTANCTSDGTCDETTRYRAPDWSFDGQKIAYQAVSSTLTVVVSSVSGSILAQGGEVICCASSPIPQWSPDGTKISYFGTDSLPMPFPGVAVMNADATGSRFITGAQNAIATISTQSPGGGRRWRP